jgi:hypothetical protein
MRFVSMVLSLALALGTGGCVVRSAAPSVQASRPAPRVFPSLLVATRTTVLRLAEAPEVRIAFPRVRLPLRLREAHDGEVTVAIEGGIEVAGVVKLGELGVLACRPGPMGDHYYAGNDNLLSLRSVVTDGHVRVGGLVVIRQRPFDGPIPFAEQFREIPFEGDLPVTRLCDAPPPKRHAGTAADPSVAHLYGEPDEEDFPAGTKLVDIEKGAPLTLLDAPAGKPLHTIPANPYGFTLVWLRREGAWDLVAAGGGPYLLGWIPSRTPREDDSATGGLGLLGSIAEREAPIALYKKSLESSPLRRLPAGSAIRQLAVTRARFMRAGWARVVGAPSGAWSYVVAAVDADVTVEGWLETAKLGESVAGATPAPR